MAEIEMAAPVFTADPGGIISLLIFVFAFISWLVNKLNEQQKPPRPVGGQGPQPRPRPREARLQKEIDAFLKQAAGDGKRPERPIEVVDFAQEKRSKETRGLPSEKPVKDRSKRRKSVSTIADRKPRSSDELGQGVRKHLEEHMKAGRVSSHVDEYLSHDVNRTVESHLGTLNRQSPDANSAYGTSAQSISDALAAQKIVDLLRDSDGIRQAVILNEILSPPKSLRRRP